MTADREDRLQQYLDGRLNASERAAFEQELLEDDALMGQAYDELNVRDALAERAGIGGVPPRLQPRPRRSAVAFLAVATAASIAFVAFILPRPDTGDRVFRGGAGGAPVAVAPVGEVPDAPSRFVWTRDPGAMRYRIEIYLPDGDRLHVSTTADTFFTADGLAIPRTGSWRATTLDSVGVGVRSTGLVEFEAP